MWKWNGNKYDYENESGSSVEKALTKGDKVSIVGFGAWSVAEKEAADAVNKENKK